MKRAAALLVRELYYASSSSSSSSSTNVNLVSFSNANLSEKERDECISPSAEAGPRGVGRGA